MALDLTDISKPYAKKMEFLAKVWDGMSRKTTTGYWNLEVVGAEVKGEKLIPLYSSLYSQEADDFESENKEVLKAINIVNKHLNGKGIWVIDRGGDRKRIINQILPMGVKFIIRMKGDRFLVFGEEKKLAKEIAESMSRSDMYVVEVNNQGHKEKHKIYLGRAEVKFPGHGDKLFLVVVKGFGDKPMLLLTNVDKSCTEILEMYLPASGGAMRALDF